MPRQSSILQKRDSTKTMGFTEDYLLLVFSVCCGAIQIAAWQNHLTGLYIFNRPAAATIGIGAIIGGFLWFFGSENRNLPDTMTGLAGSQFFALFMAGLALALLATLIVSSCTSPVRRSEPSEESKGLDALRQDTYFRVLRRAIKERWTRS